MENNNQFAGAHDEVIAKFPRATARYFPASHDWEVYKTEDTDHSPLLGSGVNFPHTEFIEDESDFKSTEEAAWADAARNLRAVEAVKEVAEDIIQELFDITTIDGFTKEKYHELALWVTARKVYDAQAPGFLRAVGNTIRTQDNRITADPLFVVFEKKRVYGMDPRREEAKVVWIHTGSDYEEADESEHAEFEKNYGFSGEEPEGWERTAYVEKDVFVTACFTEASAKRFIHFNQHNLTHPFVYAASLHRNYEMIQIREFLRELK